MTQHVGSAQDDTRTSRLRPGHRSGGGRRGRLITVLAATVLALAACAGAPADPPDPGEASPIPELGAPPPSDDDGPGFTATTLDGDEIHSSMFAGTPVVLWFWAPWCTICQAEGPVIAEVAAEFDGRVEFVGVPGLGTVEEMETFVADTGTDGLLHMVDDGSIWQRFGVVATPSHGFVTSDGDVEIRRGWLRPDDLRERTEALLD